MDGTFNENDISRIVEADRAHVWHHLSQHKQYETNDPRIIVEGKGLRVWDQHGKEHIDAVAGGVWTVNVGYGRETMGDAVRDAIVKMNFFGGTVGTIPGALFAEKLISKMPGMDRVYYANSGSEANEKAFKMVRQIAHKRYGGKKHKILYRDRDYHGTTIACLSAGGQEERNAHYGPYTPGFVKVPHCLEYRKQWDVENYGERAADAIEEVILREGPDTVGAICLEPVTAGGGVITPPEGYWQRVQEICRKYDILLHIDEVVCGMGRTGTWFGYQNYGVKPDFVTMAKGVASGYAAISCMVTTEAVFDQFKDDPNDHLSYFRDISTFGGCTSGPAAALENLRILEEEKIIDRVREDIAPYVKEKWEALTAHPMVGEAKIVGLMGSLALTPHKESRAKFAAEAGTVGYLCRERCFANGLVMRHVGDRMIISPPLVITKSEVDLLIERAWKSLDEGMAAAKAEGLWHAAT